MTSIEEAYLPLNIRTCDSDGKIEYIKELYSNIDVHMLNEIKIEGFDPVVLKTECANYREIMLKYLKQFGEEQQELITLNTKLKYLIAMHDTNETTINSDSLKNALDTLISQTSGKMENLERQHIQTTKECKYVFSTSPHYVDNDPRHLCPICVTEEVDNAIVPCGHTVCGKCAIRCDLLTCFICRDKIDKIIKLYYI